MVLHLKLHRLKHGERDIFNKTYIYFQPKINHMKCEICKEKIEEIFLGKIKGTIVKKTGSSQPHYICQDCQKKYPKKEELLEKI